MLHDPSFFAIRRYLCLPVCFTRILHRANRSGSKGGLHKTRTIDPDARRREALQRDLHAEGFLTRVSDHDYPHALLDQSVRTRSVSRLAWTIALPATGEIHLRLPG